MTTDIQEAQTRLAELIEQAVHGADVVITVDGVPQARLTPIELPAVTHWDVQKYGDLWKVSPVDGTLSSTEIIRGDRDGR